MFENRFPLFESGRLLKNSMLNELRDYPRNFIDIRYEDYSDGIICGCEIDVLDNVLVIKKGIVKHNGIIYFLEKDENIDYECNNKLTVLKVKFLNERIQKDFIENNTEIYLDENTNINSDEMELCRFFLRSGAHLRIEYTGFDDLNTEYDTVQSIHVPYAAHENPSLSPKILKMFGRELLNCNVSEAWDINFSTMCIQEKEAIEREIIINYLAYKLEIDIRDYSNERIYYYLLDVLKRERENSGDNRRSGRGRSRKILID